MRKKKQAGTCGRCAGAALMMMRQLSHIPASSVENNEKAEPICLQFRNVASVQCIERSMSKMGLASFAVAFVNVAIAGGFLLEISNARA